eukprot:2185042-Prymnesium_polylepis.1
MLKEFDDDDESDSEQAEMGHSLEYVLRLLAAIEPSAGEPLTAFLETLMAHVGSIVRQCSTPPKRTPAIAEAAKRAFSKLVLRDRPDFIVRLLQHNNSRVRFQALVQLREIGPMEGTDVVTAVALLQDNEHDDIRVIAGLMMQVHAQPGGHIYAQAEEEFNSVARGPSAGACKRAKLSHGLGKVPGDDDDDA